MKMLLFLAMLVSIETWTVQALAAPAKMVSSDFIRPYHSPPDGTAVADTLTDLYKQLGATRYEFEYSLPAKTGLLVKVIFSRNGIIDRNASTIFSLTPPPSYQRNAGFFVIDRIYPTCKCPSDHNRWHLTFNNNYDYGFPEGTPNNYRHSSTETQNTISDKATKQEQIIFSQEDKTNKFSLIIRARCVPMPYKNTGGIKREPLKYAQN